MRRVSDFIIIKKCKDGNYVLLQSYLGSVDVVSSDVAEKILKAQKDCQKIELFSEQENKILYERGYLTDKDKEQEKQMLAKASESIKSIQKKRRSITIIPSYECNFRCSYCFEQKNFKDEKILKKVLTEEMIDNIFFHLKKMEEEFEIDREIVLFGGEPLTKENRKSVECIAQKAKARGYSLFAVTNGYDVDKYMDLLGEGIEKLQITLDGDEFSHDKRRFLKNGAGTYQKICNNINIALDKGIKVIIRSNIDIRNLQQLSTVLDVYKHYGWTGRGNFSFYFKNVNFDHTFCMDKYAMSELDIIDLLNEKGILQGEMLLSTFRKLEKTISYLIDNHKMLIMRSSYCGATGGMLVFDPFGYIYSCWNLVGNENCAIGKWNKEEVSFNELFEKWDRRIVSNISECSECEYALLCGGGCAANNMKEGYQPNCEDFKQLFDRALLKVIGEKIIE